jgi:predicted ArsR family transcriptional regulator
MAASIAWLSLSGAAVKVYVELRRRYNGGNNGDLSLSLDEAARLLHLGKATVARAFAELEAKGFIRMTRRGRWYGRQATTYAVTDRPMERNPPTNAWRTWRAVAKNHSSVPKWTEVDADGSATEPRP